MALVARWPLAGNFNDTSGNGFHLTGSPRAWYQNECAWLDGGPRTISRPHNAAFNLTNLTIHARIARSAQSQNAAIFEKGLRDSQYSLYQAGTSLVFRTKSGTTGHSTTLALTTGLMTNANVRQWFDVWATYDGVNKRIYTEGVQRVSAAYAGPINNTDEEDIYIGRLENLTTYFYNGLIADVEIYDHALTGAEIATEYSNLRALPEWTNFPVVLFDQKTISRRSSDIQFPPVSGRNLDSRGFGTGRIYGQVLDDLGPLDRWVHVYLESYWTAPGNENRLVRYYLGSVRSNIDNGFWEFRELDENRKYTVMAFDEGGVYDPLIRSGLTPVPM